MPTLPKLPPSSLRPNPPVSTLGSTRAGESRPYLVSASYRRSEVSRNGSKASLVERTITLYPHESEDARLTGSTRSLFRRLLALNLPTGSTEPAKAPVAAAVKYSPRSASA
jgi:hypothetical protein